ncbi:MAG TPA: SIS domain-containing protein [Thermoanaerobaculia bacterium]|nr:SIS domain-containing protein [Thermoanaerobaculia bacterium]
MSLHEEIHEQPAVLARLLADRAADASEIARAIRAHDPRWVLLAARGTSDNAGLYAQYVWGSRNGLAVAMATPSLFTHYGTPPRLDGALVVGISQSGQSPDIVGVLAEARRQGAPTLAITNEPESSLAREAIWVLPTGAGPERAVAATKTYTTQLLAVAMLSAALRSEGGDGNGSAAHHASDELDNQRRTESGDDGAALSSLPDAIAAALVLDDAIAVAAARYREMARCVVLGRGFHYATACEWALKLEELTYAVAEPYSTADFRHGPLAIVGSGFPVLAVVPGGAVFDDALALLTALRERGADLVTISDRDEALALARTPLRLAASVPEWLRPIVDVVPGQLFSYHLARAMGRDTEAPRGLSKVTRTW